MPSTYTKLNEFELQVTTAAPILGPTVTTFNRAFIESQIVQIQKSKDDFDTQRNSELFECVAIRAKMIELGIITGNNPP